MYPRTASPATPYLKVPASKDTIYRHLQCLLYAIASRWSDGRTLFLIDITVEQAYEF
jgi:hypothetical protein